MEHAEADAAEPGDEAENTQRRRRAGAREQPRDPHEEDGQRDERGHHAGDGDVERTVALHHRAEAALRALREAHLAHELVDERVELADLFERGVLRVVGVDVGAERNRLRTAFRPFIAVDGGVERDAIHPRVHAAALLELVEAQPQSDENLLEEVVDFLLVAGEHVTDRVDCPLVLFHQFLELLFLHVFHLTVWFLRHWTTGWGNPYRKNHFFCTATILKPTITMSCI